jgi:Xaa-Pro aminopeptidase
MASLREKKQRGVGFIDSSISAMGQRELCVHPGMSETEIQGIHEFVYKIWQVNILRL